MYHVVECGRSASRLERLLHRLLDFLRESRLVVLTGERRLCLALGRRGTTIVHQEEGGLAGLQPSADVFDEVVVDPLVQCAADPAARRGADHAAHGGER